MAMFVAAQNDRRKYDLLRIFLSKYYRPRVLRTSPAYLSLLLPKWHKWSHSQQRATRRWIHEKNHHHKFYQRNLIIATRFVFLPALHSSLHFHAIMRWWSICGDVDIASEPRSVFFLSLPSSSLVLLRLLNFIVCWIQSEMRKSKSFTSFACGDTFQTEIRSQENRTFCERRFIRCSAGWQQCQLLNSNLKRQDGKCVSHLWASNFRLDFLHC